MGANWSAPIRSFFGKDKNVKEEVQHGVEVMVNAAEQGLHQLDEATSGAVSSIAEELSKAGVDMGEFKNSLIDKLEHDVEAVRDDIHKMEDKVSSSQKKVVEGVSSVGQGLKDELQNVQTQTEVRVEKAEEAAKTIFVKTEKTAEAAIQKVTGVTDVLQKTQESAVQKVAGVTDVLQKTQESAVQKVAGVTDVLQKTQESAVETVSSLASNLASFGGFSEEKEKPSEKKSPHVQNEATTAPEEPVVETKIEETLSSWTTSLLNKEKDLLSGLSGVKEENKEKESHKDEEASPPTKSVEEESNNAEDVAIKTEVGKETPSESIPPQKEAHAISDGWSSGRRFLRDTIAKSKEIVIDSLHFGDKQSKTKTEKPVPEFQTTQNSLSSSTETKSQPETEQNSSTNTTIKISDEKQEKESSPAKEVSDFLNQEKSESSKHIEPKLEDTKASEEASASANKEVAPKHSLFDSITDISSSITNTLHNIETGIENTGKNILTGVGTKVKEAGEFIAGVEEEQDEQMNDNELKTEAVTSLLDKSFIN